MGKNKPKIREYKRLSAELRDLLNQWNPIGFELPPDEYDCAIDPLLSRLQRDCNEEIVEKELREWTEVHMGLSKIEDVGAFARKVVVWYRKSSAAPRERRR